ncbi:MAG: hypothetical protein IKW48_08335 [Akkermansia sp.]|nr:hypothetical protein [Akkermansia sp.]
MLIKSLQTAASILNNIKRNWDIAHSSIQVQICRCERKLKLPSNISSDIFPELGVSHLINSIRERINQILLENCNLLIIDIKKLSTSIKNATNDLQGMLTDIELACYKNIEPLPIANVKELHHPVISNVESGKQLLLDNLTEITSDISKQYKAAYKKAYALERELDNYNKSQNSTC